MSFWFILLPVLRHSLVEPAERKEITKETKRLFVRVTGPYTDTQWRALFQVVFPPGKSGWEISQEIWGFEISRFPAILCQDPGKFFFIF